MLIKMFFATPLDITIARFGTSWHNPKCYKLSLICINYSTVDCSLKSFIILNNVVCSQNK